MKFESKLFQKYSRKYSCSRYSCLERQTLPTQPCGSTHTALTSNERKCEYQHSRNQPKANDALNDERWHKLHKKFYIPALCQSLQVVGLQPIILLGSTCASFLVPINLWFCFTEAGSLAQELLIDGVEGGSSPVFFQGGGSGNK